MIDPFHMIESALGWQHWLQSRDAQGVRLLIGLVGGLIESVLASVWSGGLVFEVWVCCICLWDGWKHVHIFDPFHMIESALGWRHGCKDVMRRESGF